MTIPGATTARRRGELGAVRILVEGSLTRDVLLEMEGFDVRAADAGLVLLGGLPDQAALSGLLRRLHSAGVRIRAVERLDGAQPSPALAHDPRPRLVRIELEGRAPRLVGRLKDGIVLRGGVRPVIEVSVDDDDDLFLVLDELEDLGLAVWSVDAR